MSIGGHDLLMRAPAHACLGDVILRACRRYWGRDICIFQDANDLSWQPFTDPWVWNVGAASKEFFVYQNEEAARRWQTEGATKKNANTMFHFLIGEPETLSADSVTLVHSVEVDLVCDKVTPSVRSLVQELEDGFLDLATAHLYIPEPEAA
jgi:hypothetical protein